MNDQRYQDIQAKPAMDYEVRNDLVYFKNRLLVPNSDSIKIEIATSEHDSKIAGHFGQNKTNEIISRNFY